MTDFFLHISKTIPLSNSQNRGDLKYESDNCNLYIRQKKGTELLFFENAFTLKMWVGSYTMYKDFARLWDEVKCEVTIENEKIDSLFRKLNGVFGLLSIDKLNKRVTLITDHLGFFPVYLYEDKETILSSSVLAQIVQSKSARLQWNQNGIEEYLINGHFILNQGWYKEVSRIPAATVYTIDLLGMDIKQYFYWTWEKVKKRSLILQEAIEHYHELFKRSLDELVLPDEKLGISLSGGLDSRYIIQCASGTRKLESFTFSEKHSADLTIAKSVSKILNIPHRHLLLPKESGFDDRFDSFIKGDGMLHLGHLHECVIHSDIQEQYGYYFHGFFGGGVYASKGECNKRIDDQTARKHFYYTGEEPNSLSAFYNTNCIDPYIVDQKIRNQSAYSIKILSYLSKVILPFYNMNWMEFNYSLPDEAQIHQTFYLNVLHQKLDKKLLDLPWQKTGIPIKYSWINSQCIKWKVPGIREWVANQFQKSIHFIFPKQLTDQDRILIQELENEWGWFKNISSSSIRDMHIRKLSVAVWVKASKKMRSNAD